MASIRPDDLSPFGRAALKLDSDFSELTRLSAQIGRLDLESDSDLDHALKLLSQFAQRGQGIAEGMQNFSQLLIQARDKSELAAKAVGERAELIQKRKQDQDQLREKLLKVEQEIKAANARLTGGAATGASEEETKAQITQRLQELQSKLDVFIDAAENIKADSVNQRFKRIERDAQSMLDTLQSLRRKLQTLLPTN